MTKLSPISHLTLGSCLLSFASIAHADVTTLDVWNNTTAYYKALGAEVSANYTQTETGARVEDISLTFRLFKDKVGANLTLPNTTYTQNEDGSVNLTYDKNSIVTFFAKIEDIDPLKAELDLTLEGQKTIVSGDPDDMSYEYSHDTMQAKLLSLVLPDDASGSLTGVIRSSNSRSTTQVTHKDDTVSSTMSNTEGASEYDLTFTADDISSHEVGTYASTKTGFSFILPKTGATFEELSAQLADGLSIKLNTSLIGEDASSTTKIEDVVVSQDSFSIAMQNITASLDQTGIAIAGNLKDATISTMVEELGGMLLGGSLATLSTSLHLPVLASEAPQDFAYNLGFSGLTLDDMVWAMVDSDNKLPKDPIDFELAASGSVISAVNLFDVAAWEEHMENESVPVELTALNINTLSLDAIGAKADGDAAFTFDNKDTETFDGFPRPTGIAQIKASGINTLLNTLTDIGLITQEDAFGARLGLSFGSTSTGDDSIESNFEVTEEGKMILNGQKIN